MVPLLFVRAGHEPSPYILTSHVSGRFLDDPPAITLYAPGANCQPSLFTSKMDKNNGSTVTVTVRLSPGMSRSFSQPTSVTARSARDQARESLQYWTHLAISAMTVEPSGVGYSSSIAAGNLYFSFFMSRSASRIGVSPIPQGRLSPPFFSYFLSFICMLTMRAWFFCRNGMGLSLVPAV